MYDVEGNCEIACRAVPEFYNYIQPILQLFANIDAQIPRAKSKKVRAGIEAPQQIEDDGFQEHVQAPTPQGHSDLTPEELLEKVSAVIQEGAAKAFEAEDATEMNKMSKLVPYYGNTIDVRNIENAEPGAQSSLESALERSCQVMNKIASEHLDPIVDDINDRLHTLRDAIDKAYGLNKPHNVSTSTLPPKVSLANLVDDVGQHMQSILEPLEYQVIIIY